MHPLGRRFGSSASGVAPQESLVTRSTSVHVDAHTRAIGVDEPPLKSSNVLNKPAISIGRRDTLTAI